MVKLFRAAFISILLLAACSAPRPASVETAEAAWADLVDANGVLGAIDSGLFKEYRGKDRVGWEIAAKAAQQELAASLDRLPKEGLSETDARVAKVLRAKLDSVTEAASADAAPAMHCADAKRTDLDRSALSAALEACFTEIANRIEFEGERYDRVSALGRLHTIAEPERRKTLFLAFQPLWTAINGANESDSPYRRLLASSSAAARNGGSPIDAAAKTVGVTGDELEQWLVKILETWGAATAGQEVEPWDYRYTTGAADRALAGKIAREEMLRIDHRYYLDLGADLEALGVMYDLDPRPDKSSVAYCDFLIHGRYQDGRWLPTIARVLASYREGNLGSLNELVHENGHAVHISAIRNRPAFVDWNDDLFVEAFADVSAWSLYEPEWQQHYIGAAAPEKDSLRALFGSVMLDVAWALFEARMLRDPSYDPNVLWTEITHRYLHIKPHPELSWWAVRGQLVGLPGYMVNYGLGAVLTADLRERTRAQIGAFDTGNERWYPWLSENLLKFGSERDTPALLKTFLGRPVSPDALLAQLRRLSGEKP